MNRLSLLWSGSIDFAFAREARFPKALFAIERCVFFSLVLLGLGLPWSITVADVGKVAAIVFFVVWLALGGRARVARSILVPAALLVALLSFSAVLSEHPVESLSAAAKTAGFVALFVAVSSTMTTERCRLVLLGLFVSAASAAIFYTSQFLRTNAQQYGYIGSVPSATLATMLLPFLVTGLFRSVGARRKAAYGAGTTLVLSWVFVTFTRFAWVASSVVLVVLAGVLRRWKYLLAIMILPVLLFVGLRASGSRYLERKLLRVRELKWLTFRADLWRVGARIVRDRPVLGAGPGNFGRHKYAYIVRGYQRRHPEFKRAFHAHNNVVEIAVSGGLGAVVVYLLLFAGTARCAIFLLRRPRDGIWEYGLGLACSLACFHAAGTLDYSLFAAVAGQLGWFLTGMLSLLFRSPSAGSEEGGGG